jgi:hypothetical protein
MTGALARVLGLEPAEMRALALLFIRRRGRAAYTVRALALLVATSPPARPVVPRRLRLRAIRPFLYELLWGPAENLIYVRRGEVP